MAAKANPVVEPLDPKTSLRDVLPTLDGKRWWIQRLDEAGRRGFAANLDRALRGDAAGDLTDMTARDPRNVGVRGAYPQINEGLPNQTQMLRIFTRFAYRRSAPARILVDTIASMMWGEWLNLQCDDENLKRALENVYKNPTGRPGERPLYWWLERATRLARRDGRSLLYFALQDGNASTPEQAPVNVQGIVGLTIIRDENIGQPVLGTDPMDADTYGRIVGWRVTTNAPSSLGPAGTTKTLHADRCLPFIPYPSEDDPNKGESILAQNINYVEMVENLVWSSAEAYFTEASPYIIVSLDKDVELTDDEKKDAKDLVAKMQQSSTQRIFLRGVTVTVLAGSGQLANPIPHWEVGLQAFAMAMGGIPVSMLTGNQTGRTTAAVEDTARMTAIISKIQEQDADPIMQTLNARLIAWDVTAWGLRDDDRVSFRWNPIFEPNPKDFADAQWALAQSRGLYKDRGLPLPEELDYDPTEWPEGTDLTPKPVPPPFPGAQPAPQPATPGQPDGVKKTDAAKLPRGLRTLANRTDDRIRAALKPAYDVVAKRLEAKP